MSARAFNSALYQKLRGIARGDAGLCARCPARAAEDRNYCDACLEKDRVRHRTGAPRGPKPGARGNRWAEMFRGDMTPCQIARAAEDRSMCERCLETARVRRRKGTPRGRKPQPRGDRWAEMFRDGQTPGQIARAEGVDAGLERAAHEARGLWPVATVKP